MHLAMEWGCKLAILRLSSLYGPKYREGLPQRMIRQGLRTGSIEVWPPFENAFDILYVSDAARTVQLAVKGDKAGLWNVGSGRLTTVRELAETCARHIGAKVGFLKKDAEGQQPMILNWVDDARARDELGHTNQVSLKEGILSIAKEEEKNAVLHKVPDA